jgi:hypothetical protein
VNLSESLDRAVSNLRATTEWPSLEPAVQELMALDLDRLAADAAKELEASFEQLADPEVLGLPEAPTVEAILFEWSVSDPGYCYSAAFSRGRCYIGDGPGFSVDPITRIGAHHPALHPIKLFRAAQMLERALRTATQTNTFERLPKDPALRFSIGIHETQGPIPIIAGDGR